MPNVLCLRPIHPDAMARLRAAPGITLEVLEATTPQAVIEAASRAEAVIVRLTPITRQVIEAAPRLRLVARHGVGYDLVDVPALTERGIPLTITPEANAVSVAEHALMLMLAAARRVIGYDANMRRPVWGSQPDLPTFDLAGRSVLVVGFGRIGTRVAKLCAAFGMRVLVRDPAVPPNTIRGLGYTPTPSLEAALPEADIVTLHLPANEETRGLVDGAFLGLMKRGAVLVNTARGTLVDEAALERALRDGRLGAAALDVFAQEPVEAPIPLLSAPNLILTPHVAASTAEGVRRMSMSCVDSVLALFEGRLDPEVVVNPEVLLRRNAV